MYLFNMFFSLLSYIVPIVSLDSAEEWQLGFQDPASPIMQGLIEFHHDLCFFLIIVLSFVF